MTTFTVERPTPDGVPATLLASGLDFALPPRLEATVPPEARGLSRDQVRLLVSYRRCDWIEHSRFDHIAEYLEAGDLLVLNDSVTLPAALIAGRAGGERTTLHLSTPAPGEEGGYDRLAGASQDGRRGKAPRWVVEPRPGPVSAGEALALPGGGQATFEQPYLGSSRLWVATLDLPQALGDYLARHGRPITYPYVRGSWPIASYQTAYATAPGSAEMPSAGRAFTLEALARLVAKGVGVARITLHTGVASLEHDEPPYPEWCRVPAETVALVNETRARGGRVIAVGTTVVRALESAAGEDGLVGVLDRWTAEVITPDRGVRVVDGLLTGFHEPRASHLLMLAAIAGRAHLAKVYAAALAGRYLWHEFGDLHLIL